MLSKLEFIFWIIQKLASFHAQAKHQLILFIFVMRKKLDPRIHTLLHSAATNQHRSLLLIVGDRARFQVPTLQQLLGKAISTPKPSILWCYKKDLGFTTHRKKREQEIKNHQMQQEDLNEPFNLFLSTNQIRFCYYAETHKILGNTFQLLVLSDFEAITPNILCRTIETVQGGGLIVFLLKTMSNLQALYAMAMDVHSRLRTHKFQELQPRFNERFILSLTKCQRCLFIDDELNLLPLSSACEQLLNLQAVTVDSQQKISELAGSIPSTNEIAQKMVMSCKTLDQAKVIMSLIDMLHEKVFRYTMSIQAGRGRGKSAAIGMAAAAAVRLGFSNIFITAPSPENLTTFFQFLTSGLETLEYRSNQHYEIIQSTNPDFNKAIIRINISKTHRQFVQYIQPQDFHKVQSHTDLLFCDEAAAIPIQFVKSLFGPYNLVMSSTINGYEGTGRSLSLKLIQKLREQNRNTGSASSRLLKELQMNDPIRYSQNDPVEAWLYELLLLNATNPPTLQKGLPHPNDCELYLVNRDTLFSYQKTSEKFLFNLMSLFISSHYKNSPNDLQLLSDAPAHAVFVLLGPLGQDKTLPDILCAIQVCFEGLIPTNLVEQTSNQQKPSGDLIPWTLSKYYLDNKFPSYSGLRIIRIATHSSAQKMGYGSKALDLLDRFCRGELIDPAAESIVHFDFRELSQQEKKGEKKKLPPLMKKLTEVRAPEVNYLGVSFGLTQELYKFWSKNNFLPTYLSLRKNDTTGEYTCIVLKPLQESAIKSVCGAFAADFRNRFISLLAYDFKDLEPYLCIDILNANITTKSTSDDDIEIDKEGLISRQELLQMLTLSDYQRLDNYCRSMSDFYLVLDILPDICKIFFQNRSGKAVRMSRIQAALLLAMGLQKQNIEASSAALELSVSQALPLFNKAMRKMKNCFKLIIEQDSDVSKKQKVQRKEMEKRKGPPTGKQSYEVGEFDEDEVVDQLRRKDVITLGRRKEEGPERDRRI